MICCSKGMSSILVDHACIALIHMLPTATIDFSLGISHLSKLASYGEVKADGKTTVKRILCVNTNRFTSDTEGFKFKDMRLL